MSIRPATWAQNKLTAWRQRRRPDELTLDQAPVGKLVQLQAFDTTRTVTRRLVELGLTPRVTLSVVQDSGGPIIVAVRGSRIALGRNMARQLKIRIAKKEHDHHAG